MPQFSTSSGLVTVANWGYQLQAPGGLNAQDLASVSHDLIVMDFSNDGSAENRFSAEEIADIKDGPGGRSVAVAYMSIGEASEFRNHWDTSWTDNGLASGTLTADAPDWLGPTNPDWPESRKVRFWDDEWQENIFNDDQSGWLDQIVAQGFDAAYLDIVDAYYYWAVEAPNRVRQPSDPDRNDEKDAAERMIDFIVEMTAHARQTNPDFFVILQNGAFILDALEGTDPARKAALLDAIGAIAVEDAYFRGHRDENNPLNPDNETIQVLQNDFLDNGIPVFVVDYVSDAAGVDNLRDLAISDGFIPFAAGDRELSQMTAVIGNGSGTMQSDYLVGGASRDIINAKGGNDVIEGQTGNDRLSGGGGHDLLMGGAGRDRLLGNRGRDSLFGGDGADKLLGGRGRDHLTGGDGADQFVFRKNFGRDLITDFQDDIDIVKIDDDLWVGDKTIEEVIDLFGIQSGNRFVLDFGEGDRLVFRNTSADELLDDMILV